MSVNRYDEQTEGRDELVRVAVWESEFQGRGQSRLAASLATRDTPGKPGG
jgi:hypothetical protein